MNHTDTDIAEILQRFDEDTGIQNILSTLKVMQSFTEIATDERRADDVEKYLKDFITRECLALKKKWEREHFDNQ